MSTKPKRFLLTGGRAPATLDLARLLKAGDHQVFIAESLPIHLCQYSRAIEQNFQIPAPRQERKDFVRALVQIIKKHNIDIFIPTCEEIFHVAHAVNQFPKTCQVWCEPIERLATLHNKATFVETAQQIGIPVPRTSEVYSRSQLEAIVQMRRSSEIIVLKPAYSRFSTQTKIFHRNESIPSEIQPTTQQPWLVQDWVEGQQVCTYSIAKKGELLLHSAYQTEFTADVGATIAFAPFYNHILQQHVVKWLSTWQLTGQFAFDWIYTPEGNWVALECNPRLTSGIHLFQPSDQLAQVFTDSISSKPLQPHPHTRKCLQLAMWSYGIRQVRSRETLHKWLKTWRDSSDVLFQWRDPMPLWGQLRTLGHLLRRSRELQCSLLEVSTYDIEWNGEA